MASSKAQVLTQLDETRKAIKSKFRNAYKERVERERKLTEAFKPITSRLDYFKGEKKKETKDVEPRLFQQSAVPAQKNLKERGQINVKRSKRRYALDTSDWYSNSRLHSVTPYSRRSKGRFKPDPPIFEEPEVQQLQKSPMKLTKRDRKKLEIKKHAANDALKASNDIALMEIANETPQRVRERRNRELNQLNRSFSEYEFSDGDDDDDEDVEGAVGRTSRRTHTRSVLAKTIATPPRTPRTPRTLSRIHKKTSGQGIKKYGKLTDLNFIPYNSNNRIVYEYFDDPNELVLRLKLLTASKNAGNNNHMPEISSILEELRELGHI